MSVAVLADAPVLSCIQSPLLSDVFCNVDPQVVVPFMLAVSPEARLHAYAPDDPEVSADEVRSTVVLPFCLKR